MSSVYSFSCEWLSIKTWGTGISCLLRVTFVPMTRYTRAIFLNNVKVKAVPLHAKQEHRRGNGIVLPLLDHGARREWVIKRHAPGAILRGIDPVPILQETEWASGPVWTGPENLAPPGFELRTTQPVASHHNDYLTYLPFLNKYAV